MEFVFLGGGFTQDACISLDSDNLEKIKNLLLMICSKNNRSRVKSEMNGFVKWIIRPL